MNALLLAIAPIAIILVYVYCRDKYDKEPLWLMALCILAGAISVLPVFFLGSFLVTPLGYLDGDLFAFWKAFVLAAFNEELFKFVFVMLVVWRSSHFNEKFDGIVYAVCVSLGFALVENILYVLDGGTSVAIARAFSSVPAHAVFGMFMGYFLGFAKMNKNNRIQNIFLALIVPILIHGIYDFILMSSLASLSYVFEVFLFIIIYLGLRRMNKHSENSRFRPINNKPDQDIE